METLQCAQCESCAEGTVPLSGKELADLITQIPGWEMVMADGVMRLQRIFGFDNFVDALSFTNKVAELAEAEGHHPALLTEWGRVTVTWWTHKIGGLHRNDFILAARTDSFYPG